MTKSNDMSAYVFGAFLFTAFPATFLVANLIAG
jgi:hypothetical protein